MVLEFNQRQNAASSKQYYAHNEPSLSQEWGGKGLEHLGVEADRLGLREFNRLIDNRHPLTNQKLTPRDAANRICCWDITVNVPKSVTLLRQFAPNGHQVAAAVKEANAFLMGEVEKLAATRERKGGKYGDQPTGNLIYRSDFHQLARPVKGRVMPHDHIHNVVMNATWAGDRFMAAKVHAVAKALPELQQKFHDRLRSNLHAIGFRTKGKGIRWQMEGIKKSTVKRFSERRGIIEKYKKGKSPRASKKAALATREEKPASIDLAALKAEWSAMLKPRERHVFKSIQARPKIGRGLDQRRNWVDRLRRMPHTPAHRPEMNHGPRMG